MRKILDYKTPKSLEEAIKLFKCTEKARFISGGTRINMDKDGEYSLIDLKNCGLNYIEKTDNGLKIGAFSTITDILESGKIEKFGENFKIALETVGYPQTRNQATLGGSIAACMPWFNLATVLLVLDAQITMAYENEEKNIKIAEFFENREKYLKNGIIKEVFIPFPDGELNFTRFSMNESDYASILISSLKKDNNIKVAISGCLPYPKLIGSFELKENLAKEIFDSIKDEVISTNINFSVDYIKEVLPTLIEDNIK